MPQVGAVHTIKAKLITLLNRQSRISLPLILLDFCG